MSSPVADLEAGLKAMLAMKPPGVSGTRIQSITALCIANVQSESVLIQKLYTHFKRTPATHKLGVLYVVDSVTRKWTEHAKSSGQVINSDASDGTFAAGVHRVKELLPSLMNDIISSSPDDQKDKIRKLVDIWEKGQTFPSAMLAPFKEKLIAQSQPNQPTSTTPPGSPPPSVHNQFGLASRPNPTPVPTSAAPTTSSILQALASIAKANVAAPPTTNTQPQNNLYNVNPQNIPAPPVAAFHQNVPFPPPQAQVNMPTPTNFQPQAMSNGAQSYASNQAIPPVFGGMPQVPPPTAALDPVVQQQMIMIKALLDSGVPAEQIPQIMTAMGNAVPPPPVGLNGVPLPPPGFVGQNHAQNGQNGWGVQDSRDRNGHNNEQVRSPPNRFRNRSRSRSPQGWNGNAVRDNDRRGEDFTNTNSPGRNRDERGRGRGGRQNNEFRQRSPPRRRSPSPLRPGSNGNGGAVGGAKWISHDASIGAGKIKVLSRTLFVGGVSMSDTDLRSIFASFGTVQTCIVNKDKRHAFVKMISRTDALSAKSGMEALNHSTLRTRWGVGFGPRDCSDYTSGISVIPISKLTDADRKWLVTAEYGGTGGKEIVGGLVVEEPDIEIGTGVSSKAISRRMQTDTGGSKGPKSGGGGGGGGGKGWGKGVNDMPVGGGGAGKRAGNAAGRMVDEFGRDVTLKEKSPPPTVAPPVPAFGFAGFPAGFPIGFPMQGGAPGR